MFTTLNKVKNLIDQKLRIKFVYYFIISFILILLEFFGIAILFPIIDAVTEKKFLFANFLSLDPNSLLYFLLFTFVIIIFLKNCIYIYLSYWQYKFVGKVQTNLSKKLIKNYLLMPYRRHQDINSSVIIKNIDEAQTFSSYLFALLNIILEIFIVIVIFILLMNINFYFTILSAILILFVSLLFYYSTKLKLVQWSKQRIFISRKMLKDLFETFNSIREIKKYSREDQFLTENLNNIIKTINISIKTNILKLIPKSSFEICLVVLVALLILFLNSNNIEIKQILPTLAVFIAASIRLIPSGTKIMNQYQAARMGKLSVEIISNELKKKIEKKDNKKYFQNFKLQTLKLNNLNFSYDKKKIIQNLDLKFETNKTYGIIGQSGSGKTTLANLILNLLEPDDGKILVNDTINLNEIKNDFQSFVPQKIYLFDNTIKFNIAFDNEDKNINFEKLHNCIKISKLDKFVKNLKNGINEIIGEDAIKISGGQLQRLAIARALYNESQLIIFDEPTSSLDAENEKSIIENIITLKKDKIIIIITHSGNVKNYVDELIDLSSN